MTSTQEGEMVIDEKELDENGVGQPGDNTR